MNIILETIFWGLACILEVYFILAVVNVVLYWLMHFNVIAQGGPAFKKFLSFLHQITEPVYAKLRELKYLQPIKGFDISPYALIIILGFVLHILERLCQSLS